MFRHSMFGVFKVRYFGVRFKTKIDPPSRASKGRGTGRRGCQTISIVSAPNSATRIMVGDPFLSSVDIAGSNHLQSRNKRRKGFAQLEHENIR